jgi:hypothetical protein
LFLEAFGTDGVAEFGVGVLCDIGFDLLPIVLVVSDFFAISADGEQPA